MYEINCFKENSYTITRLTQWDTSQYVSIRKEDIEIEIKNISDILNINKDELYSKLEFNFFNKISNISVDPVIDENNIAVLIPDKLLQEPYPIIAYIYFNSDEFKKVIVSIKIPVTPRPKPDNYKENSVKTNNLFNTGLISMSLKGNIGKFDIAQYTPDNHWDYWQETNDNAKTKSTITAKPTADCLLVAAVMHGDKVSIEGENWNKIAESQVIEDENSKQQITVWAKNVSFGEHTVIVNQPTNVRMSLKVIALYNAKRLILIENNLLLNQEYVPADSTGKRRMYLLSSYFTYSGNAVSVTYEDIDLQKAEEQRFSAFYDYEFLKKEEPVFKINVSSYNPNTANILTFDIEEN